MKLSVFKLELVRFLRLSVFLPGNHFHVPQLRIVWVAFRGCVVRVPIITWDMHMIPLCRITYSEHCTSFEARSLAQDTIMELVAPGASRTGTQIKMQMATSVSIVLVEVCGAVDWPKFAGMDLRCWGGTT